MSPSLESTAGSHNVRDNRAELSGRLRFIAVALGTLLVVVAAAFWFVQIVRGDTYLGLAENNRLRKQPLEAVRGLIFDHRGRALVENVPSYNLLLRRSEATDPEASLAFASHVLDRPRAELEEVVARYVRVPSFTPVLIAESLSLAEVARFEVAGFEHPEFEIEVRPLRLYRYGPQTAHVLGYLGQVTETEVAGAESPFRPGDLVGRRGIEKVYDPWLRGVDGEHVVVVDNRGKRVEEHHVVASQPGRDLRLTLDLDLQQEIERLMEDKVGTTVVLDPRDGAVRAMVSNPSYDPNRFSRRLKPEEWRGLLEAPHHPLQNRAVQNTFPPGSLFKIIAGYAGLVEGVITPRDRVYCPGATTIYNHRFRCWRPSGHGWVNLEESLKHSCDIYFYHLGQKLGIQRLARYSRLFGLGRITGIDLAGEKPGLVPDPEWSQQVRGTRWYPGETISVAIGQGALLTSPLQVARLVAATANGGRLVTPHLLDEVLPPSTQVPVDDSARGGAAGLPNRVANQSLELDLQALEVIQRGLWKVVNEEKGTGVGAQMTEMELAGKTGTSQVITQKTWIRSEDLPWPQRDHAWFGAYGPYQEPTLVVVIFLEHGGSGSGAAPLAKAIYEKHLELDTSGPA